MISKKVYINEQNAQTFVFILLKYIAPFMFIISILLFTFSDIIVFTLLGENFNRSIINLKILSFTPFLVSISNLLGIQTMINFGYKKEFSFIVGIKAIFGIILSIYFIPFYEDVGVSLTILIVEIITTATLVYFVNKKIMKLNKI